MGVLIKSIIRNPKSRNRIQPTYSKHWGISYRIAICYDYPEEVIK